MPDPQASTDREYIRSLLNQRDITANLSGGVPRAIHRNLADEVPGLLAQLDAAEGKLDNIRHEAAHGLFECDADGVPLDEELDPEAAVFRLKVARFENYEAAVALEKENAGLRAAVETKWTEVTSDKATWPTTRGPVLLWSIGQSRPEVVGNGRLLADMKMWPEMYEGDWWAPISAPPFRDDIIPAESAAPERCRAVCPAPGGGATCGRRKGHSGPHNALAHASQVPW